MSKTHRSQVAFFLCCCWLATSLSCGDPKTSDGIGPGSGAGGAVNLGGSAGASGTETGGAGGAAGATVLGGFGGQNPIGDTGGAINHGGSGGVVSAPCPVGPLPEPQIWTTLGGAYVVGATIDETDNVYLADVGLSRIVRIDPQRTLSTVVANIPDLGSGISELAVHDGWLYFIATNALQIFVGRVDLNSTLPVEYSTIPPFVSGPFFFPGGITIDSTGMVYLSSLMSTAPGFITRIDPTGSIVELNWAEVHTSMPFLQSDPDFNVYLADATDVVLINSLGLPQPLIPNRTGGLFYREGKLYVSSSSELLCHHRAQGSNTTLVDYNQPPTKSFTRVVVSTQERMFLIEGNEIWTTL